MNYLLPLILSVFFMVSCATGSCYQVRKEEAANQVVPPSERIKVFKYDESRQCGMGAPIPLDKMEKELGSIQVFERENKSDGMMRIQVCGASTGMANVFTISVKDQEKALKRGFKIWKFDEQP